MDIISKTPDDKWNSCIITKEEEEEEEVVVVPGDLILEILSRLPSYSVFRFKFVCKSWYSLIFNPDLLFLKHHHRHQQRLLLDYDDIFFINHYIDKKMVDKKKYWREYVVVPPQNKNKNKNQEELKVFLDHALSVFIPQKFSSSSELIDSCNGLLLYCNKNPISGGETQYHVFNPITKQCFELPMIDCFGNNFTKGTIHWLHIVFDPSISLSFKVLICFAAPDHLMINSGIYVYSSSSSETSSSSSSWKYLTKFQPWNYSRFRTVLLDGFLYLYKSPYKLLCFNVAKDKILYLPLPPRRIERPPVLVHREIAYGCEDLDLLYFGVLGRRLRLIRRCVIDKPHLHLHRAALSPFKFDILELERELKLERKRKLEVGHDKPKIKKIFKWTVKHRVVIDVNYKGLAAQIIHIYKTGGAGGAGKKNKGKEEEALLFLNKYQNTIISYNLTSKTFGEEKKISDVEQGLHLNALRFTPSLFPFSC